ncbi:hypothetical protein D770_20405 [Flammeovirgaceae bacterium 311]|nr:hypothetical protein D770_20405 [Flammeovirgaceae bacterium 311]
MMLPSKLRQQVKISSSTKSFMDLCLLIEGSQYARKIEEVYIPLPRFLILAHIQEVQQLMYMKIMKCTCQGKLEMSFSLSIPELLSLWTVMAHTPLPPGSEAQVLIDQVDKHACDIGYLINYKSTF